MLRDVNCKLTYLCGRCLERKGGRIAQTPRQTNMPSAFQDHLVASEEAPMLTVAGKLAGENSGIDKRWRVCYNPSMPANLPAKEMLSDMGNLRLIPTNTDLSVAAEAGFRFGDKGTHTSRTMMLTELTHVLDFGTLEAKREDYAAAIIEDNCLGKPTASTRRLTNQRLGELYGLDPATPLFRVFRKLWEKDSRSRPLLSLLCALARDPLLASTADAVVQLEPGAEFLREPMRAGVRATAGDRLNDSTLGKVVRNAASSWTQSGHLEGRALKKRRRVTPTPGSVAFALYLAYQVGFRGKDLFTSGWVAFLDCSPTMGQQLALEAKRLGLIDFRMAADVVEIGFNRLEQHM